MATVLIDDEHRRESMLKVLAALESQTRHLRQLGLLIAVTTAIDLLLSIFSPLTRLLSLRSAAELLWAFTVFFLTLVGIVLAIGFETRRKHGDILFKELSDEFQWLVRSTDSYPRFESDVAAPSERPDINARIALRAFAQTSDLPLVPGKFGPLTYTLMNILSCGLVLVGTRLLFS